MRKSGFQRDELGIEFGFVLFRGNGHHHCIISVRVVPMTLEVSKRVTKKKNTEPTKVSVFPSSREAWHKMMWEGRNS